MLDKLFGWRKASKCKKLIKRFRCRLNLVKMKRYAVAKQLRGDIVELLKNGYQQIAFNRLEQLYMDDNMILVYEFLDQFAEFIILNLSYIRKHKDLPKDVNEAVSTLIFASARCGDLPELMSVRKLFQKRYGYKYTTIAVELHPGNRVNQQVKEKLTSHSVSQDAKNRLFNEIVKDCFYQPEILPLEYKPDFQVQHKKDSEFNEHQEPLALEYKPDFGIQSQKVMKIYEDEGQDRFINKSSSPSKSGCSIVLQSFPSIVETPKRENMLNVALSSPPTAYEFEAGAIEVRKIEEVENSGSSSENSPHYSEDSVVYLDDVQEFQSPTKQGTHCEDQDQRFFIFSFSSIHDKDLDKKRPRRRSKSRDKQTIDDIQSEIYYSYRSNDRKKYQKKVQFEERHVNCLVDHGSKKVETSDNCACMHKCSLHQPCYSYTNNNNDGHEIVLVKDYMGSPLARECGALAPYTRDVSTPERQYMEMQITEISKSTSVSPKHVHPKLPDYDEIAAKFRALKEVHQQNKCTRS